MFDLADRVALVTGARRGMGAADARYLARSGATVIVTDIDQGECQRIADDINDNGGDAIAFKMDVSDPDEVASVFEKAVREYGRIDILVNNAGIFRTQEAVNMSVNQWDEVLDINLRGQFLCAREAAQSMIKNGFGRIINIASIASGQVGVGVVGAAHYTASKGGVIGMTETLAAEWAQYGITVNVIAPGAIDTPMASASDMPDDAKRALLSGIPMGRMGTAEEIAAAVVFFASNEASYITGATLHVDGGWLTA